MHNISLRSSQINVNNQIGGERIPPVEMNNQLYVAECTPTKVSDISRNTFPITFNHLKEGSRKRKKINSLQAPEAKKGKFNKDTSPIILSNSIENVSTTENLPVLECHQEVQAKDIYQPMPQDLFNRLADKYVPGKMLPPSAGSCRFPDIKCPEETHIGTVGEKTNNYLHANSVNLKGFSFISTQYPLIFPHEDIHLGEAFWNMSLNSCLIVDLTNKGDHLKSWLVRYSPNLEETLTFNNVGIKCVKKDDINSLSATFYTYEVEDASKKQNIAQRLHFEGWSDTCGINIRVLDQLVSEVNKAQQDPSIPVVIHCRAGVGRTGTLTIACVLKRMIETGVVTAENLEEHMTLLILDGRRQRGPMFVQTPPQLETLWNYAHFLLKNTTTTK